MAKRTGFGPWIAAVAVLVLLGGGVPYGLLAGQQNWLTAGFWLVFGVAVIVLIAVGVRGWRDR